MTRVGYFSSIAGIASIKGNGYAVHLLSKRVLCILVCYGGFKMADINTLSFARKYRPSTFAGYIGNDKLKTAVMSALTKDTRPQVILLEGASGCGKTTFARLLAKEYSCESRDDVAGACGTCYTCQQLDEYIHTGATGLLEYVREIDIADNSSKRDLDEVFEEMMLPTFGNQWRIYIFDECHEASDASQNRMLKIAEEPPENVLMIFCTTAPDRMIETLKNRCQIRLHVKKPTVADLAGLLKKVCINEGVDYDIKGLNFIATRSGLTIREALNNIERIINEVGNAKYESAIQVFEEISDKLIVDFYKTLIGKPEVDTNGAVITDEYGKPRYKRDILKYVSLIHDIRVHTEFKQFAMSLRDFTVRGIYTINGIDMEEVSEGEYRIYRDLFGSFTIEQLSGILNKMSSLLSNNKDIELNLLLLGYTGILDEVSNAPKYVLPSLTDTKIPSISGEVGAENNRGMLNRESRKSEIEQVGITNAEELTKACNLESIQNLFGGATVVQ